MNQNEINACVGKTFQIRGAAHLCVASGSNSLLLLQIAASDEPLFKTGDPVQYIIAKYPDFYKGELVWGQGEYYLPDQYSDNPTAFALRDAANKLVASPMYIAMVENDEGTCCVGVFANRHLAEAAFEKLLNSDEEVTGYYEEYGKTRFTFAEYEKLYLERNLDNGYWVEEHMLNRTQD